MNLNGVRRVPFEGLSKAVSQKPVPKLVLAPVFGHGFDIYDVAQVLSDADFRGNLKAIDSRIPSTSLVQAEIARSFPDLNFEVVSDLSTGSLGQAG